MAKTIALMQPTYLPWLGYFDLIRQADVFVIYNSVQFEKQSWQQRNRIRNKAGELLLTVPVKSNFGQQIREVELFRPEQSLPKHLRTIEQAYCKARNYNRFIPALQEIYSHNFLLLQDLNLALIKFGMQAFGITTPLIFSSELNTGGAKVEGILNICKKLNATVYLSPPGARGYIEEDNRFAEYGIELRYQQFRHPEYQQQNYPDFISHLSFVDYLFNSPDFN